jgi:uncharacterized RDD family membrane protein YckC
MNWHYVEQGKQTGPVSGEQFNELVRSGKIQPDTLVWHDGMATWLPHREVLAKEAEAKMKLADLQMTPPASFATTAAPKVPAMAAAPPAEEATEAVCAECGKIFPIEETIRHGSVRICANCKPVFMQKLAEGAQINTGEMRYARILTRFAALLLDGLILGGINMCIGLLVGLSVGHAPGAPSAGFIALQFILIGIELAIGITYEVVLIGKYGATLGKMACKIKVVTADGGRVSYGRAFGRYFSKMLSGFACLLGYIIAIFDNPQKRALHDRICNTRVVYK